MIERGSEYYFNTGDPKEKQRLDANAALWDPFTFRMLDQTGVGDAWRCLEVGGGSGSVASWLAARVGPHGHVVVTDLETRWLSSLAGTNIEVRRHDVTADPLELDRYDLIHARLVLMHLPQREAVLRTLVAAMRPGGWLVVEDYDHVTFGLVQPPNPAWTNVEAAEASLLRARGVDPEFGIKLPNALRAAGLADVAAEGFVHPASPAQLAAVFGPVRQQMRTDIIDSGLATKAEFDEMTAAMNDQDSPLSVYSPTLVSARGRRPEVSDPAW